MRKRQETELSPGTECCNTEVPYLELGRCGQGWWNVEGLDRGLSLVSQHASANSPRQQQSLMGPIPSLQSPVSSSSSRFSILAFNRQKGGEREKKHVRQRVIIPDYLISLLRVIAKPACMHTDLSTIHYRHPVCTVTCFPHSYLHTCT